MKTNEIGFIFAVALDLYERLKGKPVNNIFFTGPQSSIIIEDRVIEIKTISGTYGHVMGVGYDEQTGNLYLHWPDS